MIGAFFFLQRRQAYTRIHDNSEIHELQNRAYACSFGRCCGVSALVTFARARLRASIWIGWQNSVNCYFSATRKSPQVLSSRCNAELQIAKKEASSVRIAVRSLPSSFRHLMAVGCTLCTDRVTTRWTYSLWMNACAHHLRTPGTAEQMSKVSWCLSAVSRYLERQWSLRFLKRWWKPITYWCMLISRADSKTATFGANDNLTMLRLCPVRHLCCRIPGGTHL